MAWYRRVRIPPTPPKVEKPAIIEIAGFSLRINSSRKYCMLFTAKKIELLAQIS
uniref:Uncharacterized protein n=1 Tax=Siphoviridae sp. ctbgC51 TaxID=2827901 RepID=A0A8S5TEY1_9CAUD|nr:MAG TPA: hypothetical protein [Siphoviridae sp. ctbgC51]